MNRDALDFLIKHEETRKIFFNRGSDDGLTVFIRDPRLWGGNPNVEHWQLAREIEEGLQARKVPRVGEIKIDKHAGLLVINVAKFYSEAA